MLSKSHSVSGCYVERKNKDNIIACVLVNYLSNLQLHLSRHHSTNFVSVLLFASIAQTHVYEIVFTGNVFY